MPIKMQDFGIETPSPDRKWGRLQPDVTPKSVGRSIFSSPAYLKKQFNDITELSMSPLVLVDSPAEKMDLLTPSGSSQSSSGESIEKRSGLNGQTSTPGVGVAFDTSNKNKAFVINSKSPMFIKAKRRLIDDEETFSPRSEDTSLVKQGAAKKQKTMPRLKKESQRRHRSFGGINAGVSHKIRRPKPVKVALKNDTILNTPKVNKNACESSVTQKETNTSEQVLNKKDFVKQNEEVPPITNMMPKKKTDEASTRKENTKPTVPEAATKIEKTQVSSPKIITRNWNQGYRETRERKFFKSRTVGTEGGQERIVTVSVNDNLKLQIRDKPVKKSPVKRSSPRKKPVTPVIQKQQQPAAVSINQPETNVSILQQDWDDVGDDMDMSTNIQEILEGLSKDDSHSDPPPASADSCLSAEEKENKDDGKSKLFPLFYKETSKSDSVNPISSRTKGHQNNAKSQWIKARNDGENQTIIDAGQKVYGAIQCKECMLVYHAKEPDDELLHAKIHESLKDTLKFTGWKKERIVRRFTLNSYIIAIHPGDPAHCWNKVNHILKEVVDNELGFSEIGIRRPDSTKVYLYINDKKITGVLVAEGISQAFRLLPAESTAKCCSTDPVAVVCGISRIWTLASFRRHKAATHLLDAMRSEFVYGKYLGMDEIAFSAPTENGIAFAQSYAKRADFAVYNM